MKVKQEITAKKQLMSSTQRKIRKQKKGNKENTMVNTANTAVHGEHGTPDSEKSKAAKEGKKNKTDSNATTSNQTETPDSLACQICKQVFVEEDVKVLSCDRCE